VPDQALFLCFFLVNIRFESSKHLPEHLVTLNLFQGLIRTYWDAETSSA